MPEHISDQHQFLQVLDRDEAERRFRAAIQCAPLGAEIIPLDAALGRVLAADVVSPVTSRRLIAPTWMASPWLRKTHSAHPKRFLARWC